MFKLGTGLGFGLGLGTAVYRRTDSTIDYFDVSAPVFAMQFAAVQF